MITWSFELGTKPHVLAFSAPDIPPFLHLYLEKGEWIGEISGQKFTTTGNQITDPHQMIESFVIHTNEIKHRLDPQLSDPGWFLTWENGQHKWFFEEYSILYD